MANEEDEFTKDFNQHSAAQKERNDKLFIKGFNAGYLLNQHEPDLLKRVIQSPNENNVYIEGMKSGKKQHEKDNVIEEIKQIQKSKDKGRDKE